MWFEKQASYALNMGRVSETEPSVRWDKFKLNVSVGGKERKAFTVDLGCIALVIRKVNFPVLSCPTCLFRVSTLHPLLLLW